MTIKDKRLTTHPMKQRRRDRAAERQRVHDERTPREKLERAGAKERAKLMVRHPELVR